MKLHKISMRKRTPFLKPLLYLPEESWIQRHQKYVIGGLILVIVILAAVIGAILGTNKNNNTGDDPGMSIKQTISPTSTMAMSTPPSQAVVSFEPSYSSSALPTDYHSKSMAPSSSSDTSPSDLLNLMPSVSPSAKLSMHPSPSPSLKPTEQPSSAVHVE